MSRLVFWHGSPPPGMLEVTVVMAENIAVADRFSGSSDPYVRTAMHTRARPPGDRTRAKSIRFIR